MEDDHVDRLQVEVQQCMEPSSTNYPNASFFFSLSFLLSYYASFCSFFYFSLCQLIDYQTGLRTWPAKISTRLSRALTLVGGYSDGGHLFPFRTEKLSSSAPMVLPHGGRVGRCQLFFSLNPSMLRMEGFFFCPFPPTLLG